MSDNPYSFLGYGAILGSLAIISMHFLEITPIILFIGGIIELSLGILWWCKKW